MKKKICRYVLYFIGFTLIALSIALHNHHNLGNNPLDKLYYEISVLTTISVGYITIILNAFILLVFFLINKNKDIIVSIIGVLCLGFLINFFMSILTYDNSLMYIKIIEFLLATNIGAIGVVLILNTKLSMMALECLVKMVNSIKGLKKLSFGTCRAIVDVVMTLLAVILELSFNGKIVFGSYTTTLVLILISGPLIDLYQKLYEFLFMRKKQDYIEEIE